MHLKQLQHGGCLIHAFTTDLAIFALVFRHAAGDEALQTLTPLMPTTLDSLASTFESATLLALQQTGHFRAEGDGITTAEQVQAWCQRVVVEGVEGRVVPTYDTTSEDFTTPSP
jgi:hypothetical protein